MPGYKTRPEVTVAATRAQTIANVSGQTLAASEVTLYAPDTNTDPVYIGDNTVTVANGLPIPPGGERSVSVTGTNEIYHIGTAGDKLRVASIARY